MSNKTEPPLAKIPTKISVRDAIALQKRLRGLVSDRSELPPKLGTVAGADGAYTDGRTIAVAALLDYKRLNPIETSCLTRRTTFPYVPGLLAFREAPAILAAIRRLATKPDVCLIDGHGLAHPRRFGLACYVGLILNAPTIGVAKRRLYGREEDDRLLDGEGEVIGAVVRPEGYGKSLYVSIGHKISLEDAVEIVKHCTRNRGPEPILIAHQEAKRRLQRLKR